MLLSRPLVTRTLAQPLLLLTALVLAPLAMRLWLWGFSSSGLLSDLLTGLALAAIFHSRRAWLLAPVLLVWAVAQSGAVELVEAVGRMPELADIEYLTDPAFVSQSAGGNGLTQPLYFCSLLILALLVTLLALRQGKPAVLPAAVWSIPLLMLALHTLAMHLEDTREPWKQYNVVHRLVAEKVLRTLAERDDREAQLWAMAQHQSLERANLQGTSLLAAGKGSARNVLVITLEGIPGAYIRQIREARGYQWDQEPMPQLSAFARDNLAMHTADYVVHNHQTIRGLYSMLCGDYTKLDGSTPKALEMLASHSNRHETCLPAQLAAQGFATHFLQATDLAFMSKDRVMPHIGFQTVCGDSCIRQKKQSSFVWGLDDKAFFDGTLAYIKTLRSKPQPWLLTLLTVGTHQPYGAPDSYLERYPDAKMASVAYLDESITRFLTALKKTGVMDDTLVIVTSDESHGIEELRLASAWGLSLIFAPERAQLPAQKQGVYGHIDLAASVLDYFGLPAEGVMGRSQFRQYPQGRDMLSYTNGFLRYLHADGQFHECQLQSGCRNYRQGGFITPTEIDARDSEDNVSGRMQALASLLNRSLSLSDDEQDFLFASEQRRKLKTRIDNDWTDNLIGAQYLEFPQGSRAHVSLRIKALKTDRNGAQLQLRLKEFDRDSDVTAPELPLLRKGESIAISFDIDNPAGRRAFSFHLLGHGTGEIEIEEFKVSVRKLQVQVTAKRGNHHTSANTDPDAT